MLRSMLSDAFIDNCIRSDNPLFHFAFVEPERLDQLAELAETEPGNWNYPRNPSTDFNKPVLFNYIRHTFKRALEQAHQGTITCTGSTDPHLAFDTGLLTEHYQAIYGVFQENRHPREDKPPFYLRKYCIESDLLLRPFESLPTLVSYVDNPGDLVIDFRKRIVLNLEHIVDDNVGRFPSSLQEHPAHILRSMVQSAIDDSLKRARRNYKIAIPQFFWIGRTKGRVQLLLPLCLMDRTQADLAVAFDIGDNDYRGSTILTLDMAYNNARLLARPDRDWLDP